jgi:hypothetical protein
MKSKIVWILRLLCSGIMLQTLWFKFTGAPESIYIFTTLGVEPWGRYLSGIAELVTSILILIPKTTWLGALKTVAIISGAILSHIFVIGIEVNNDGGTLFILGMIALISALILVILTREDLFRRISILKQKYFS